MTNETYMIIGGGQAGAQAVDTLRREGYGGRLLLLGEERELPYQRPPLSKKYLSGEMSEDRLPFRHRAFYEEHRVDLLLGARAVRLDPAARSVGFADGASVDYDRLLLCLGAAARRLACPGADLAGIHYLRSIGDAVAIRARLQPGARAVIIGGGYIGLEIAATCRLLGLEATVLEMGERIMNRVVAPVVSEFFARAHRARGVRILCNSRVVSLEGREHVERVVCADGARLDADLVVVGVGALPVTELAAAAGLACDNGIVVDEYCRSSNPAIFAAGDCTNQPSPRYAGRVRLESVDNAFEQAKSAALNMLDRHVVHDRVPWFWSDQFEHKLLIVGLSAGHDECVTRGDPDGGGFSVLYLKNRELIALEAVDHSRDYMVARKLIAARARLDVAKARDGERDLKDAL
ncbi:MAG TPA: FAD-dependent oxidoreductase [Steroidobacteraceae bacterium]|nr:FAD-dependent oxidoreductase [Steroidobacteraceae bacterium]